MTDRHIPYAERTFEQLVRRGIRVEKDLRNEKLGFKIREAQLQKIPYMLVVGDREEKEGTFSPRERSGATLGSMGVDEFARLIESQYPKL